MAIGSAYAVGALALGAFLVVGFAIHNTTEGLAIVAPIADARPSLGRLVVLGRGISIGDRFELVGRQPFDGPFTPRFGRDDEVIGGALARSMRVELDEPA